jgi:cell division protein FtsB
VRSKRWATLRSIAIIIGTAVIVALIGLLGAMQSKLDWVATASTASGVLVASLAAVFSWRTTYETRQKEMQELARRREELSKSIDLLRKATAELRSNERYHQG